MKATNPYKPEIDGIRAFAVFCVIINHLSKDFLPSGFLGVDIFFVLSGYLIISSLKRNEKKIHLLIFLNFLKEEFLEFTLYLFFMYF